ncbi:hypothetical protein LCGC14_0687770 [marine sediment metagenome]|uniref:Uncharacterized protein n=1 Tax=marine sediment metagenome TaxID=412755 RepID=A0A0F9T7K9_9ZZZZ
MTDPKQSKYFYANGKKYIHLGRHCANSRSVNFTKWVMEIKRILKRNITKEEGDAFKTGYNMGYKEGKKRAIK